MLSHFTIFEFNIYGIEKIWEAEWTCLCLFLLNEEPWFRPTQHFPTQMFVNLLKVKPPNIQEKNSFSNLDLSYE